MGIEIQLQPSRPPKALADRTIYVQLNAPNTVVIPHDLQDDTAAAWAFTGNDPSSQPARPQRVASNEVVYLVDGVQAYPQFQWEIEQTNGTTDFVYLLGWDMDVDLVFPDFKSDDGSVQKGKSMKDLLTAAGKRKVQIRVMLDGQIHNLSENKHAVDYILYGVDSGDRAPYPNNAPPRYIAEEQHVRSVNPDYEPFMRNYYMKYYEQRRKLNDHADTAGVVDAIFPRVGSHHQKILIVKHGNQLTSFCGGLDINADRIPQPKNEGGNPQHDVHCRIRGPAAWDVLQIFLDRWADYVSRLPVGPHKYEDDPLDFLLADKAALRGQQEKLPPTCGKFSVQIARTTGPFPYKFAPHGERSIRMLIKNAISKSQRFIYLEDQYLVSMEIATALSAQLPKLKHITILVPPSHMEDWASHIKRRTAFINNVRAGGTEKVRVFCLNRGSSPFGCNTYVHSKTWIFDDKFAVIGSANCDNRGMAFDSESDAGIYDASDNQQLTYTLPHRLRMRLWAHHLCVDEAELVDGVASASLWLEDWRPTTARVEPYTVPESVRDARFGKNVAQTLGRWPEDVVLGGTIDPDPEPSK